jgi:type IV pilus assembly protein PilQ
MLRRSLLFSAVLALLTINAFWSGEACAEEPDRAATTPAEPAAARPPVVTAIGVVKSSAGTQITISGDAALAYEYFVIEGKSLAIDIPGAASSVWPAEQQVDDEFVSRIRVAAQTGEKPGVRVVLALREPAGFTVRGDSGKIVVLFPTPKGVVSGSLPAPNRVVDVTAARIANAFRVAVKTDAQPSYRVLESGDPRRVIVAIAGARLEPGMRKASDYANLDTPVTRISSWSEPTDPTVVLVAIDLRQPLPFRVFTDGYGLNVDFSVAVRGDAEPVPSPPISRALTPGSTQPSLPATPVNEPASLARDYSGRKITLDFLDADITDIFRLIADVSGMNIVATDDVKGKRSVKMSDVPWDQALDLILKTNIPQLVQIGEADNIIRVTTQQRVLDDQAAVEKRRLEQLQRALAEQKQGLEKAEFSRRFAAESQQQQLEKVKFERQRSKGWMERTYAVSYGDTKEVATRLEKFYSGCKDGCVFEAGDRSKTIFVRDFVDNIEQMTAVFSALESPTSAVMVEARIVEVQSDYSEAIGIQWGANFIADAAHGNATPYAFPNTIGIGGTQPGNYLVNLPATGAVSGVGIALGHVANTFSLDVKLSALEKLGKTKILSNPKVLVIQNEEANINVGSQLPVPKTDASGNRTVEWKDVGILLKVTPNVTSDGRVFMKVKIEKSSAGVTVKTTEGEMFSIERRGAETKVLVGDGETSVIGGIFQQTDAAGGDGVPGLSRLPIIGWLFKSRAASNNRTELMIFLTPRIVNTAPDRKPTDSREVSLSSRSRSPAADAGAAREGSSGVFGTVNILSSALSPAGDAIRAVVHYTNDTAFTFASSVTINCRAVGQDGKVIGADNGHVLAKDSGPIVPDFQADLELSFPLAGAGYTELRCTALAAE